MFCSVFVVPITSVAYFNTNISCLSKHETGNEDCAPENQFQAGDRKIIILIIKKNARGFKRFKLKSTLFV